MLTSLCIRPVCGVQTAQSKRQRQRQRQGVIAANDLGLGSNDHMYEAGCRSRTGRFTRSMPLLRYLASGQLQV